MEIFSATAGVAQKTKSGGGGGEPTAYIKSITLNANKTKAIATKKDNTQVEIPLTGSGDTLPSGIFSGEVFILLEDVDEVPAGIYQYNGSLWVRKIGKETKEVDTLPATSQGKEGVLYLVNKKRLGTYESTSRPVPGEDELLLALNDIEGVTPEVEFDLDGWYHISVETTPPQQYDFPVAMMDYRIVSQSSISGFFRMVESRDDALFHCYEDNYLLIPIDKEYSDMPQYCYAKPSEGNPGKYTFDPPYNTLIIDGDVRCPLNQDFEWNAQMLFNALLIKSLAKATLTDANLVFDVTKQITNEGPQPAPYAVAVKTYERKYDYTAVLRDLDGVKSWEKINYAPTSLYEPHPIETEDDPRPVTRFFARQMLYDMIRRCEPLEIPAVTYTGSGETVIPTPSSSSFAEIRNYGTNIEMKLEGAKNLTLKCVKHEVNEDTHKLTMTSGGVAIIYTVTLTGSISYSYEVITPMLVLTAPTTAEVEGYTVPALTNAQITEAYNATNAGKTVKIQGVLDMLHMIVTDASDAGGIPSISAVFRNNLVLTYSDNEGQPDATGDIEGAKIGGGGGTQPHLYRHTGAFMASDSTHVLGFDFYDASNTPIEEANKDNITRAYAGAFCSVAPCYLWTGSQASQKGWGVYVVSIADTYFTVQGLSISGSVMSATIQYSSLIVKEEIVQIF